MMPIAQRACIAHYCNVVGQKVASCHDILSEAPLVTMVYYRFEAHP